MKSLKMKFYRHDLVSQDLLKVGTAQESIFLSLSDVARGKRSSLCDNLITASCTLFLEGNNHFMQSDKNLDSSSSPVSHLRLLMTQRHRPLLAPLHTVTLLPQWRLLFQEHGQPKYGESGYGCWQLMQCLVFLYHGTESQLCF